MLIASRRLMPAVEEMVPALLRGEREKQGVLALSSSEPGARVRIGRQAVNLWDVSTSAADGEFDRSVLAGEAGGRWLWIVLRPASALLLLTDDWMLRDVSHDGPALLDLPFGGHRPAW